MGEKPAATVLALLIILAAIAAALSGIAQAAADNPIPEETAFLVVSLVNQNPEPAAPGETVELKLRLENKGAKPAEDAIFEILPRYPIIVAESEKTKKAGTILGRQTGTEAVLVRFFLTIDTASGTGLSPVSIRYRTASSPGWTVMPDAFNVSISQRDLPVSVTSIMQEPEALVPGEKAAIRLTLANFGSGDALSIRARLNLTESMPIAAYNSTNEAFIPIIKAKGSSAVSFSIITSPDAKSALYKIPLYLSYSDKSGKNYTTSLQSFGIIIGSAPKFFATVINDGVLKFNSRQKVTIELVNSGFGDVKLLTAKLARSDYYDIISQETTYIGDLDAGDSETIAFDVIPRQAGPFLLELDFSDALNKHYQKNIEVPVKVYTSRETSRLGIEKSNGKGILIIIVIVALGLLAYRKLRKRK